MMMITDSMIMTTMRGRRLHSFVVSPTYTKNALFNLSCAIDKIYKKIHDVARYKCALHGNVTMTPSWVKK